MKRAQKRTTARILRIVVEIGWYLQILGFLFALGTGVAGLFGVDNSVVVPFAFELEEDIYEVDPGDLGSGAVVRMPSGSLEIQDPARGLDLGMDGFALLGMVVGLVVWYKLRRIVGTLDSDDPFDEDNARRMRIVAFLLLGWEVARAAAHLGWSILLSSTALTEGLTILPVPDLQLGVLFAGLALLVLAEVFREGTGLREEQRLTV